MTTKPNAVGPFRRNDAQVVRGAYAVLAVLVFAAAVGFLFGFLA